MDKRTKGLYRKFSVARTDRRDFVGEKHYGCEYFVLDLTHDPFAKPAIEAYAEACREEYPVLSKELIEKAKQIPAAQVAPQGLRRSAANE